MKRLVGIFPYSFSFKKLSMWLAWQMSYVHRDILIALVHLALTCWCCFRVWSCKSLMISSDFTFWKWSLTPHNEIISSHTWLLTWTQCLGIFPCARVNVLHLLLPYGCSLRGNYCLEPSCWRWVSSEGRSNCYWYNHQRILSLRGSTAWQFKPLVGQWNTEWKNLSGIQRHSHVGQ